MNKTAPQHSKTRASSVAIALLAIAIVAAVFGSWAASVLGYDNGNLLSEEGVRWMFRWWTSPWLLRDAVIVAALLLAVGALQNCGLGMFRRHLWSLAVAVMSVLAMLVPLYLLVMRPEAPLQSITGQLLSSPFLIGIVFAIALIVLAGSMLYGLLSGYLRSWEACANLFSAGLQRHAAWVVVWLMAEQLYHLLAYIILYKV